MRVVLGVTGGIAAFKSLEVLRALVKSGHTVETVVTANALRFVGRTSFEALSGNKCHTDLFEDTSEVPHVSLAKTDLVLVAPATASFIARYANGLADDLLLNVLLATKARVVVAPAMHTAMWQHPATVRNLDLLRSRGVEIVEPEYGELTSGDVGQGRLADSREIVERALRPSQNVGTGSGVPVVVTAGGTREPIDSVRFLGNNSSGLQGIELARALAASGYQVTLVGANILDPKLEGVEFVYVSTHAELSEALERLNPEALFMSAAVSDFSVAPIVGKIKRSETLQLSLTPTEDIVAGFARSHPNCRVVAFAAEDASGAALLDLGRQKLIRKGVRAIVANPIGAIGSSTNSGYVVSEHDAIEFTGTKREAASQILSALKRLSVLA